VAAVVAAAAVPAGAFNRIAKNNRCQIRGKELLVVIRRLYVRAAYE